MVDRSAIGRSCTPVQASVAPPKRPTCREIGRQAEAFHCSVRPEKVVDILVRLSRAGLDGMLLTALQPEELLDNWASDVLPLVEQAGLRKPFKAPVFAELLQPPRSNRHDRGSTMESQRKVRRNGYSNQRLLVGPG